MADKEPKKVHTTPEGRLINGSLFVKDQFNEKAVPSYKLEMAFEPGQLDALMQEAFDVAAEKFGDVQLDIDGGTVATPFLNGDDLAAKREAKGKKGDAYKGKIVIRAHTIYNADGKDAPGGIAVYDENVVRIEPVNSGAVYNGCFGQAGLTMNTYTDSDGAPGVTFYLSAFQKRRDGEKLVSAADHSKLFTPTGRTPAAAGAPAGGKRVRKG